MPAGRCPGWASYLSSAHSAVPLPCGLHTAAGVAFPGLTHTRPPGVLRGASPNSVQPQGASQLVPRPAPAQLAVTVLSCWAGFCFSSAQRAAEASPAAGARWECQAAAGRAEPPCGGVSWERLRRAPTWPAWGRPEGAREGGHVALVHGQPRPVSSPFPPPPPGLLRSSERSHRAVSRGGLQAWLPPLSGPRLPAPFCQLYAHLWQQPELNHRAWGCGDHLGVENREGRGCGHAPGHDWLLDHGRQVTAFWSQ